MATNKNSPRPNAIALARFLILETNLFKSAIIPLAFLASASRGGLIMALNAAAVSKFTLFQSIAILTIATVMTLVFAHLVRIETYKIVEKLQAKLRMRVARKMLYARPEYFLDNDNGPIYTLFSHEMDQLARASVRLAESMQSAILILICAPYLFWLSWVSAVSVLAAVILGGIGYAFTEKLAVVSAERANLIVHTFFNRVNDFILGFKELRFRSKARKGLEADLENITQNIMHKVIESERIFSIGQVWAQASVIILLCVLFILLPLVVGTDPTTIMQIMTVILLTYAPIELLLDNYPRFVRATVSMKLLQDMERKLAVEKDDRVGSLDVIAPTFKTLELKKISVQLSDGGNGDVHDRFDMGPINLQLKVGQVVFITGGNGSGKSTLMSVLTGLRRPDSGQILLDGVAIAQSDIGAYRQLFSTVLSDFYLFETLYGVEHDEIDRIVATLPKLALQKRVTVLENKFQSLALSSGQRRRLALVLAVAEERPVIVLDEFAADQDPEHRALFYDVILPELAASGRLVIAVTHDDTRFQQSDLLIKMDAGEVVAIDMPGKKPRPVKPKLTRKRKPTAKTKK